MERNHALKEVRDNLIEISSMKQEAVDTISRNLISPEHVVESIQRGEEAVIERLQESSENNVLLSSLNILAGFLPACLPKDFEKTFKGKTSDPLVLSLLSAEFVREWNPLIHAIYFQQMPFLRFFSESPAVYGRKCLLQPFAFEDEEEDEGQKSD